MVGKYATGGRVFSLGIGEDASRELVNGLARAGNGAALFVSLLRLLLVTLDYISSRRLKS